jgi:hypothetical protein
LEFAKIDLSRHRPSRVWVAFEVHATRKFLFSLDEELIKSCGRKRNSCRLVSELWIDFAGELVKVGLCCSTSAAVGPGEQIQRLVFLEFAACGRDIGRRENQRGSQAFRDLDVYAKLHPSMHPTRKTKGIVSCGKPV